MPGKASGKPIGAVNPKQSAERVSPPPGYRGVMQVAAQQAKPTDAQIQAAIENQHWQEHEQSINNAWSRQNTATVQQIQHHQFMVDHLATPILLAFVAVVVALVIAYCYRKATAADIERNRDDNAADVLRAQEILDKNEAA